MSQLYFNFINSNTVQEDKIRFNMQLCMTCDASWVDIPSHLELMNTSRSFGVQVDPRGLPHGAHYTEASFILYIFEVCINSNHAHIW